MTAKRQKLLTLLSELSASVEKATAILEHTLEDVKDLPIKPLVEDYEWEELKDIEVLTARFARLSDIFVKNLLRIIDELELEFEGTIIDSLNRAEKRGHVESAELLIQIRELRNEIAHEYIAQAILDLFETVRGLAPKLIGDCKETLAYCKKNFDG